MTLLIHIVIGFFTASTIYQHSLYNSISKLMIRSEPLNESTSGADEPGNDSQTPISFYELEYKNWQLGVDAYDDGFGPLTRQCIPTLLSKVNFPPTVSVDTSTDTKSSIEYHFVDVATGPGYVLSSAISKALPINNNNNNNNIHYTGLDFSENFLRLASKRLNDSHPTKSSNIDFVLGNAEKMPLKDESVDSMTCNFGILHLSDPDSFLREAYRCLKPGGRLSFSVWSKPPTNEPMYILSTAITRRGNPNVPLPAAPPFFKFSDPNESKKSMETVGFVDISVETVKNMEWKNLKGSEHLWNIMLEGTARTRALLEGQTEEETIAVKEELDILFKTRMATNSRPLSNPAVITSGLKPKLS